MAHGEKIRQVRIEIARAEREGHILRPSELIQRMAARGLHIGSGQASTALKTWRHHRADARKALANELANEMATEMADNGPAAEEPEDEAPVDQTANPAASVLNGLDLGPTATYDELLHTAQFARECGGMGRAADLILQLTTLVDPFCNA